MIAAYGPYAASATGGNDLARDFLAGIAALYSTPCKFHSTSPFPFPISTTSLSLSLSHLKTNPGYPPKVYENIGTKYQLEYPSTILACLSVVVIVPIYIFYWKGEWFRDRSKFAKELNAGRQDAVERRRSSVAAGFGMKEKRTGHVENV